MELWSGWGQVADEEIGYRAFVESPKTQELGCNGFDIVPSLADAVFDLYLPLSQ
jgi:hypothetical protein